MPRYSSIFQQHNVNVADFFTLLEGSLDARADRVGSMAMQGRQLFNRVTQEKTGDRPPVKGAKFDKAHIDTMNPKSPPPEGANIPPMGLSSKLLLEQTVATTPGRIAGITILTWDEHKVLYIGQTGDHPEAKRYSFAFTKDGGLRVGDNHQTIALTESVLLAGEVRFRENGTVDPALGWNRKSGTYEPSDAAVQKIVTLLPFTQGDYRGLK